MVRPAPQTSTAPRRPVFIPGAVLEPGAHWNYEAGYCALSIEFLHWTVGTDSRALIRNRGLAAVLVRDGVIYQYAPLNAVLHAMRVEPSGLGHRDRIARRVSR